MYFKQQLPAPSPTNPRPATSTLHLIAEECAGMPQVGVKNAEFSYYFEDPK